MFGARAYAGNLNNEEMLEALDYAHRAGCRIYLTVNTLLKHKEIEGQLILYIRPFYEHGLDAVIVQDSWENMHRQPAGLFSYWSLSLS